MHPVERTYCDPVQDSNAELTLEEFALYSDLEDRKKRCEKVFLDEKIEQVSIRDPPAVSDEHFGKICRGYQQNETKLLKKIQDLESQLKVLKKKYSDLEKGAIFPAVDASEHAVQFAKMITNTRHSYAEEEKILAQNLNYMSSKAYNFMRDDLLFALPHKTTLLRWRPIRFVAPGLQTNVLDNLSKIVKDMSESERLCTLIFDEIGIKGDLTYNKTRDLIDGFVDDGAGLRQNTIGSNCEEDDDLNLDWNTPQEQALMATLDPPEPISLEDIEIPDDHFAQTQKPAEIQVQRYYTG
ncbi:uncharacterized protein LOC118755701, partial [Rhagoletis pomonella]|uniref:uncharacterized protein LOC118755701 n=1 Tax=Rhagoletis pomonella TaxID=28610 RepID=UPI001783B04D